MLARAITRSISFQILDFIFSKGFYRTKPTIYASRWHRKHIRPIMHDLDGKKQPCFSRHSSMAVSYCCRCCGRIPQPQP